MRIGKNERVCVRSVAALALGAVVAASGCGVGLGSAGDPTGLAVLVAAKTTEIAALVGGPNGFGGTLIDGYLTHVPAHMGFLSASDLAPTTGGMAVRLENQSFEDGTFHLTYLVSHMGLSEQTLDVEVGAGGEVIVELPCAEIIGIGPIEDPGEAGCHLATGEAIANTMAVPGFLGLDYACGGVYECVLTQDLDDLDGDGDTDELILLSATMEALLRGGESFGYSHAMGSGMMGSRFRR